MVPEAQAALLTRWASGTGFELHSHKSPKAEFARLAQVKGWIGGDDAWRTHWKACFGEVYAYGFRDNKAAPKIKSLSQREHEQKRQIFFDSDLDDMSDYSIISAAPSVHSLDSNGSVGGVDVSGGQGSSDQHGNDYRYPIQTRSSSIPFVEISLPERTSEPKKKKTKKQKKKEKKAKAETNPQPTQTTLPDRTRNPTNQTQPSAGPSSPQQLASPFWYQFPGFVPRPTAPFRDEFARLQKHSSWGKKAKRSHLVEALNAEVAFHYGTCLQKLDRWQQLCEEVGVEEIPTSINKCKKELKAVRVNLFNLIDHRRDPDVVIKKFATHKEFAADVRKNMFPRACAKKDGFIKVLLKLI